MLRTVGCTVIALVFCTAVDCQRSHAGSSSEATAFEDDFDGPRLDRERWLVGRKNWGGKDDSGNDYNGGVIPENVSVRDGQLILTTLGDLYEGPLRGINRDGSRRPDGRRVGAMIATRGYLGPGRYEVRLKVAPQLGVASAVWTFHYAELGDLVSNQEIDIEFPGRPGERHVGASFEHMLASTWIGEKDGQFTTHFAKLPQSIADGRFHVVGFEWRTGSGEAPPRVSYFVDDKVVATIESTVPTIRGRLELGAWFPKGWAGRPQFGESQMVVDWVRFRPIAGEISRSVPETYPDAGWE